MVGEERTGNTGRWENDELGALRYAVGYFKHISIGFGVNDLRDSDEFKLRTTNLSKEKGYHNCYLEPAMIQFTHSVRRATGTVISSTDRKYFVYAVAETVAGELVAFVKTDDDKKECYAYPIYMDADGIPGIIDDDETIKISGKTIDKMIEDYDNKYILPDSKILTYIEVWPRGDEA